jgi:hypothetical protein
LNKLKILVAAFSDAKPPEEPSKDWICLAVNLVELRGKKIIGGE